MEDKDYENDAGEEIQENWLLNAGELEMWLLNRKNSTILNQEEVVKLQEEALEQWSTLFSVSKSDACLLLLRLNIWTTDLALAWFDDENRIREKSGLLKKPLFDSTSEDQTSSCRLCSKSCNTSSASCGHPFCGDCWRVYIRKTIDEEGAACLLLRCPEPDCTAAVGPDLVQKFMLAINEEAEYYEKYKHYLLKSYAWENHELMIKWCPAPDCSRAIRMEHGAGNSYYVTCVCSRSFCWNCMEQEDHRPVDCNTAAKWRREKPAEGNKRYDRYMLYWNMNGESKKNVLEVFDAAKKSHGEFQLLLEACKQVIKGRQIMRWIVVYGYYKMSDIEERHPKQHLFKCLQNHAEVYLESLENLVDQFLANKVGDKEFANYRVRLQDLTGTATTCFENLVRTLEEGFPQLSSGTGTVGATSWTCVRCTYVNAMSADNCEICGTSTTAEGEGGGYWSCHRCTYFNPACNRICSLCSSSSSSSSSSTDS